MDEKYLKIIEDLELKIEGMEDGEDKDNLIKIKNSLSNYSNADASGDVTKLAALSDEIADAFSSLGKTDAKIAGDVKSILGPASDIYNAIEDRQVAKGQIRRSEAELDALEQPEGVRKYERSDVLQKAIKSAERDLGVGQLEGATSGLRRDILDQYTKDIQAAKVGSAGQAGSFSSLGQVASNRRLRGAMALQDAKRSMRADANQRLDRLASADIAENQAAAMNDRARAQLDYGAYRDAAEAAGGGRAAGMLNLRTGRGALTQGLLNAVNPQTISASDKAIGDIRSSINRGIGKMKSASARNSLPQFDVMSPLAAPGLDGTGPDTSNYKVDLMNFDTDGSFFDLEDSYKYTV